MSDYFSYLMLNHFWLAFALCIFFCGLLYVGIEICRNLLTTETKAQKDWRLFVGHYPVKNGAFVEATKKMAAAITALYATKGIEAIFPVSQAERLLDAHHRQWKQIMEINGKIAENAKMREKIGENLRQLQTLGESNQAGELSFKELAKDAEQLLSLRNQIEASSKKLEEILPLVELESKKATLQRETNQLADKAVVVTSDDLTQELTSESALDLEHQITFEVKTYLQLEKETQQRLGNA